VPDRDHGARVLLDVKEAAARLQLGRTTLFELMKAGEIASVRIGRSRRIPAAALEAYVARLLTEQCGRQPDDRIA
jgi:excisionase family DNA binding protein